MTTKLRSVQYAYALDEQGHLTHINDALRSHTYTCPGCNSDLTPVLGKINTKHYRHSEDCCALETYLHKSAKVGFFYHYQQALNGKATAVLELERTLHCKSLKTLLIAGLPHECKKIVPARYNLAELFDRVALEKRDRFTGLIPDVMLLNSETDKRAYVEICVTHPCTPEKIDSGIPILEFKIASEEDLQMLSSGSFSAHDERLTLHNFRLLTGTTTVCTPSCPVDDIPMSTWILSESGRLNERIIPLRDVCDRTYTELNAWPASLSEIDKAVNLRRFLKYTDHHSYYPNCLLCRRASEWKDGHLMCLSKQKRVSYTEARQCADYEADE